jgi:hypothetical protein
MLTTEMLKMEKSKHKDNLAQEKVLRKYGDHDYQKKE